MFAGLPQPSQGINENSIFVCRGGLFASTLFTPVVSGLAAGISAGQTLSETETSHQRLLTAGYGNEKANFYTM